MPEVDGVERLGLVQFLADLRSELTEAQNRTAGPLAEGVLRLGVEEVTVTLEVEHVSTTSAGASAKVEGKFWVFGSASASAKAGHESQRSGTQTLTLRFNPQWEVTSVNEQGQSKTSRTGLDVADNVTSAEERARL